MSSMPQIGSPKTEHGKNTSGWERADFYLVEVQGIVGYRGDRWEEGTLEKCSWKHQHQTRLSKTNSLQFFAVNTGSRPVRLGRWDQAFRDSQVRRGEEGGHTDACSSQFRIPWRWHGKKRPAYRHTMLMAARQLARPKWLSPPRDADSPLPTSCLPAQPWLWIRGRPHVQGRQSWWPQPCHPFHAPTLECNFGNATSCW